MKESIKEQIKEAGEKEYPHNACVPSQPVFFDACDFYHTTIMPQVAVAFARWVYLHCLMIDNDKWEKQNHYYSTSELFQIFQHEQEGK